MPSLTVGTERAAAQQPQWEDAEELALAVKELASRPALVKASDCHALRRRLEPVAHGAAFVVQGGDCAERFADSSPRAVLGKAEQLRRLGALVERMSGRESVLVGRLAGQYAKPRSYPKETVAGHGELPVYRGDAVNAPEPHPEARRADPRRLLRAYDHAFAALEALRPGGAEARDGAGDRADEESAAVFTSHEALLMDFERPLVREDPNAAGTYGSSAHMLWIGERTRRLDGAHVHFAEQLNNPVGIKLGPAAGPAEVRELCERLAKGRPAGRLTLISRMGRAAVTERLPRLVEAAGPYSGRVVWLCDPMHGNTVPHVSGLKSRVLADMAGEIRDFFAVLRSHGAHPGGLHLELTPDSVTECVDERVQLDDPGSLPRYESACDPRLNAEQAEELVTLAAKLL